MKKFFIAGGFLVILLALFIIFMSKKPADLTEPLKETPRPIDGGGVIVNPPVTEIPPQTVSGKEFKNQERVSIEGYTGSAMEPGISKDGNYLLFNDDGSNKDMYWAERVDDTHFTYKGKVGGINTNTVDGTPSFDLDGNVYYTSLADYPSTKKSLYVGKFVNGNISSPSHVSGNVYVGKDRWVSVDPDIAPDGSALYYSEGLFDRGPPPSIFTVRAARKTGGSFTLDESITKNINTGGLNYAPSISADGKEIFFTRTSIEDGKPVGNGIFVARRDTVNDTFGQAERISAIGGSFVEAPTITLDGKSLYYHKEESGTYVIYRVTR
ncbi:hypothetical protein A3D66_00745 [Candidatus Kaiserbacteria bacterium RIFCSPHIGHO2_02_FULL_50_9]|uniref:DUF5050 domain-containing protein n=1 Tax=Candidatus Kaiserbacteria bacterium RIFCSPLOWO2_01_FULL_51_21 TaxID=1798508 RepID=A0A1F6ED20_9BACT|nr:MAG: hypothetical protein A2761_00825 [Candidatus Kaiserbacteria bacterium RIFCSPHIGHO2_01_FULL_51_33]OGG63542.1 MAG: hypothetical protein A3D66_00745 [Candidatus Kaiserbacteria bacterium RIFCSPHIGHO2_02_FULL_50_9]OGG71584.1 MAG: hypothetical protein A3A35_02910 [Candidatus Kaiserbacteria bacterium RIFCSPLOWO2_01_FULL_51_21]